MSLIAILCPLKFEKYENVFPTLYKINQSGVSDSMTEIYILFVMPSQMYFTLVIFLGNII